MYVHMQFGKDEIAKWPAFEPYLLVPSVSCPNAIIVHICSALGHK